MLRLSKEVFSGVMDEKGASGVARANLYQKAFMAAVRKNTISRLESNTLARNPDVVRRRLEQIP